MFCQMTLILADVHIAELGLVDGFRRPAARTMRIDPRRDPREREARRRRAARAMKKEDQAAKEFLSLNRRPQL